MHLLRCRDLKVWKAVVKPGLKDAGAVVANDELGYWRMQNGYLMPDRPGGLSELAERLRSEEGLADRVRDSLRVGVHWDTQVARTGDVSWRAAGKHASSGGANK